MRGESPPKARKAGRWGDGGREVGVYLQFTAFLLLDSSALPDDLILL